VVVICLLTGVEADGSRAGALELGRKAKPFCIRLMAQGHAPLSLVEKLGLSLAMNLDWGVDYGGK
jgi:hypothetical protein